MSPNRSLRFAGMHEARPTKAGFRVSSSGLSASPSSRLANHFGSQRGIPAALRGSVNERRRLTRKNGEPSLRCNGSAGLLVACEFEHGGCCPRPWLGKLPNGLLIIWPLALTPKNPNGFLPKTSDEFTLS